MSLGLHAVMVCWDSYSSGYLSLVVDCVFPHQKTFHRLERGVPAVFWTNRLLHHLLRLQIVDWQLF